MAERDLPGRRSQEKRASRDLCWPVIPRQNFEVGEFGEMRMDRLVQGDEAALNTLQSSNVCDELAC